MAQLTKYTYGTWFKNEYTPNSWNKKYKNSRNSNLLSKRKINLNIFLIMPLHKLN